LGQIVYKSAAGPKNGVVGKIAELQTSILTLEQKNFALKQSCQKKNSLLNNVAQMVARVKDAHQIAAQKQKLKMAEIERGNSQLIEILREMEQNQEKVKKVLNETETELSETKQKLTKSLKNETELNGKVTNSTTEISGLCQKKTASMRPYKLFVRASYHFKT